MRLALAHEGGKEVPPGILGLHCFVLGSGQDLPVPPDAWLLGKLRHGGAGQDLWDLKWD